MITFSWKKINTKFEWNADKVLKYFFLKQKLNIPPYLVKNVPLIVSKEAQKPYPKGPCFLIYPNRILTEAKTPNNLYMYLELASMRNTFDYSIRGIRYLPLIMVPEYLKGCLEVNPYLKVENDKVYFIYEQE